MFDPVQRNGIDEGFSVEYPGQSRILLTPTPPNEWHAQFQHHYEYGIMGGLIAQAKAFNSAVDVRCRPEDLHLYLARIDQAITAANLFCHMRSEEQLDRIARESSRKE